MKSLISEIREKTNARIRLIPDGDVAGALMTALPGSGIDVLLGIGGSPEGVIAACAMVAMGGNMQGKLYARNQEEAERGKALGYDFNKVLMLEDLVSSNDTFFAATGITNGEMLKGVDYFADGATTESLVVRGLDWHGAAHPGHPPAGPAWPHQPHPLLIFRGYLFD
jgi:fructose-1,6-bisphosphatase II